MRHDHLRPVPTDTRPVGSGTGRLRAIRLARFAGALTLLGVGVAHIEQYYVDSYSVIPTIGTLFLLNFVSAAVVAVALAAPVRRIAGRRADRVLALLALAGMAIAGASLVALYLSEHGGLFGFTEFGYRGAIVLSIALEAATVILLGSFLALSVLGARTAGSQHSRS